MRVVVLKKSLRPILRWSQVGLFACALLTLGYCTFVLVDTHLFQERERRNFRRLLEGQHAQGGGSPLVKLRCPVRQRSPVLGDERFDRPH